MELSTLHNRDFECRPVSALNDHSPEKDCPFLARPGMSKGAAGALTETGVKATGSLLRCQAGVDLLVALRAVPLLQLHGEVRLAQLRDEIVRHRDPRAGPGAVDPVVPLTVLNGIPALMCHGCVSAGRKLGRAGVTVTPR